MAFIRRYSEAGDPRGRTMRAGRLVRRAVGIPLHEVRRSRKMMARVRAIFGRNLHPVAGDPFRFRMPKFVRKLSLKKVVAGVSRLAAKAAPIASFIPGLGPAFGEGLSTLASLTGGGTGQNVSPELVQQPELSGPPGQVYRQGQMYVPGIEVEAEAPQYRRAPMYEEDEGDEDEGDEYADEDFSGEDYEEEE